MKRSKTGRELLPAASLFGFMQATTLMSFNAAGISNYSLATSRPSFATLGPASYSSSSASTNTSVAAAGPAAVAVQQTVAGVTTPNTPGHIPSTTADTQRRPTALLPQWPVNWTQASSSAMPQPETASGAGRPQITQPNGAVKAKSGYGWTMHTPSTTSEDFPTTNAAYTIDSVAGLSSRFSIDVQTDIREDGTQTMSASSNDAPSESYRLVTTSSGYSMVRASVTPTNSASTTFASTAAAAASSHNLQSSRGQLLLWLVLAVLYNTCSI